MSHPLIDPHLPNGFESWHETHFEVVDFIIKHRLIEDTVIHEAQQEYGSCGLYELAEEWTNEFEEKNRGREWDGEFFDEIFKFLFEKNKLLKTYNNDK